MLRPKNLIKLVTRCIRDCQSFLEPKRKSLSITDRLGVGFKLKAMMT